MLHKRSRALLFELHHYKSSIRMDTEHTTADQMQVAPVVTDSTTGPVNGDIEKNGESSTAANSSASLEESLLQRVTTIKEGDNVLLRLPSDMVKAVVASQNG